MTTTTPTKTPQIVDTTPARTQAEILVKVLTSKVGLSSILLPQLALSYSMPLSALQALLNHYGYPDKARMQRAAQILTQAPHAPRKPAMQTVAVADIHPDPNNLRDDARDGIDDLATSIQAVGLLQPIVVRPDTTGQLIIVAGHRRHAALVRLKWTDVDVIVRAPMRDDEVLAAMLIENGQRRDLNPIEEARGINQLKHANKWSDVQLAAKIGRSQSHVSNRLALLDLDPDQQDAIRAGELGVTAAQQLSRIQSGKTKPRKKTPTPGGKSIPYFGAANDLATQVRNRCVAKGHKNRVNGGMGCGSCWEAVIRIDERRSLADINAHRSDCVTCGHDLAPIDLADGAA